jgi:hypothetical protein
MNRANITNAPRSAVPLEPAEVALTEVGWMRHGLLQRLVKVEREVDSPASTARATQIAEPQQRRAA